MISEVLTSQGKPAITSDQWHLIESRFTRDSRKRPFARRIVSEHANRAVCREAARLMRERLATEGGAQPEAERTDVYVRPPNFKSLKHAKSPRPRPRKR
jgi:hypothetical protein